MDIVVEVISGSAHSEASELVYEWAKSARKKVRLDCGLPRLRIEGACKATVVLEVSGHILDSRASADLKVGPRQEAEAEAAAHNLVNRLEAGDLSEITLSFEDASQARIVLA